MAAAGYARHNRWHRQALRDDSWQFGSCGALENASPGSRLRCKHRRVRTPSARLVSASVPGERGLPRWPREFLLSETPRGLGEAEDTRRGRHLTVADPAAGRET